MRRSHHPVLAVLALAFAGHAAEPGLGIGLQALGGDAGFEPGAVLEARLAGLVLRPEAFRNDDDGVGYGAAVLIGLADAGRVRLELGPRLVDHRDDHRGWEAAAMGSLGIALGGDRPWRVALQLIGTVGVADRRHGDGAEMATAAGAALVVGF